MEKRRLDFLIEVYKDCRSEIEMRIAQRDTFAKYFILSIGTIFTIGLMDFKFSPFLFFLMPLISLFYSIQILYSYNIHDRLHLFLVNELEPEIAYLISYNNLQKDKLFWESYCEVDSKNKKIKFPGIRKGFFNNTSKIMPLISSGLFTLVAFEKKLFIGIVIIIIAITVFFAFTIITFIISKKTNNEKKVYDYSRFSKADYINVTDNHKKKIIFLDRDGTLHKDKVMTHKISDLEYFSDSFSSLRRLQDMGYYIVIITNQNGIRDNVYTENDMKVFHEKIVTDLKAQGISILAIYYSPYNKYDNHISYKPNPGMLLRGIYELNADVKRSYVIGDQISDIIAGRNVGIKSIMVTTGIYTNDNFKTKEYEKITPITANNLTEAVDIIEDSEY